MMIDPVGECIDRLKRKRATLKHLQDQAGPEGLERLRLGWKLEGLDIALHDFEEALGLREAMK